MGAEKYRITFSQVASLLLTALLAACGGGGGDEPPASQGVTLSGRLSVPVYVMTDSDINDVQSGYIRNNPYSSAQSAPNPVSIGGYVSVAGSGAPGNAYAGGDPDDFFAVTLAAGQTLQLVVADSDTADLDLYLLDPQGRLLDASEGSSPYESLLAPEDGDYLIGVHATRGASNYLLSVGLAPSGAGTPRGPRLSDDFVPGEVLARFETTPEAQGRGLPEGLSTEFEKLDFPGGDGDVTLLRLPETSFLNAARRQGLEQMRLSATQRRKLDTLEAIKRLRREDGVVYAEPNYILKPAMTPDDTYYRYQWHYPLINLPQAWEISTGDPDVIVAVLDTGILSQHPDLTGQLVAGYDFISVLDVAADGDGVDGDPEDPGDQGMGDASSFHGTHVAGTVAAASDNARGVTGVAWGARIMPVRVLGVGGGTVLDISQGIRFAAGLANSSGTLPARAADVINMSLGSPANSRTLLDALIAARNAGVILIAAAGNEGSEQPSYPAAYPGVVSVSAVDMDRNRAPYSNYGATIDVAAPGGDTSLDRNGDSYGDGILSCGGDDSGGTIRYNYLLYQGTSMAAPHVAGVAALMKAVDPAMTPADFDTMLAAGELTGDIGAPGRDDEFGHGLIDAFKAVKAAEQRGGGASVADPVLNVMPSSLNFASQRQSATLLVEQGGGDLGDALVAENESWLSLVPSQVDAQGYGTYTVSVDRGSLTQGTYTAEIEVTAGSAKTGVNVVMQVLDSAVAGDGGILYVLLVNNSTRKVESRTMVDIEGGDVEFSFTGVPEGDYFLIAGSDMDMDELICDVGEACGAYTTLAQPGVIRVGPAAIGGLDFSVGYGFESAASPSPGGGSPALPLRRSEASR